MGTFQITGPNGKKYRVTGDSPAGAVAALKKMIGADASATIDPETKQPVGVPEYVPPGVEGYNRDTGMVERGKLSSALSGAADTATFGFGDELASALGSGITGVPQDQALSQIRAMQAAEKSDNPKSYLAGQLAGGVAQGLATGPGIMANAPSLGARVIGGAATGGTMGGLYGLGSGEGATGRAYEGVKDGLIGALVGGAFPVVAQGASSAYHKIADALAGKQAANSVGTSPEVLRMLNAATEADGTLGPVGQANINAAGPDAMLADAGPNARAILDTAIQRGGPGGVAARDAIADRTARAADAVGQSLDANLGVPEGITAARTAIREGTAAARGNAYDAAYNAAIDYASPEGQAIEAMVKTRVPQSAITAANNLMRTEGASSQQILAKVADDGSVVFETLPDVRQLDYITRGLNEVADQADGAGKLGGTTATGRAYSNLAGQIRDKLRNIVPEYGTALDTAADPIRRSQAVQLGAKLLSPSMTRDQVAEAVQGMTGPEKDALAQGVRSRLDDLMANVTRTVQDGDTGAREAIKAIKDLSSRANREKLTEAIGQARADALFADIDQAARSFDLRAAVAENSKTYARQATDRRISQMTEPGAFGQLLQGKPLKASQRIAQAMFGQTPEAIAAKQDAVYSQLADVLTRPAGQAQPIFDAMQGLNQRSQANQLMADRIAAALAGPHVAYPTTALLQDRLPTR